MDEKEQQTVSTDRAALLIERAHYSALATGFAYGLFIAGCIFLLMSMDGFLDKVFAKVAKR